MTLRCMLYWEHKNQYLPNHWCIYIIIYGILYNASSTQRLATTSSQFTKTPQTMLLWPALLEFVLAGLAAPVLIELVDRNGGELLIEPPLALFVPVDGTLLVDCPLTTTSPLDPRLIV